MREGPKYYLVVARVGENVPLREALVPSKIVDSLGDSTKSQVIDEAIATVSKPSNCATPSHSSVFQIAELSISQQKSGHMVP